MPFGFGGNPRPVDEGDGSESGSNFGEILPTMSSDGEDSAVAGLTALGNTADLPSDDSNEEDPLPPSVSSTSILTGTMGEDAKDGVATDQLPQSVSSTSILTGTMPEQELPKSVSSTSILTGTMPEQELPTSVSSTSILTGTMPVHAEEIPARADFPAPYKVDSSPVPLKSKSLADEDDGKGKAAAAVVGAAAVGAAAAATGSAPKKTVEMTSNPVRGAPETPKSIAAVPLSEEEQKKRQGKMLKIGGILVLLVIALAVGLGVGLGNRSAPSVSDTAAPTTAPIPDAPTSAPIPGAPAAAPVSGTLSPTQSAFDILLLYLSAISPDGGAALEDPSSPQYQAAEWLFANPNLSTYSETEINQRYALATIYLSTDGDNWTLNDGWMGESTPECTWVGIGCETALVPSRSLSAMSNTSSKGLRGITNNNNGDDNKRRAQETMMIVKKVQLFELGLRGPLPSEIAILTDTIDISAYGNSLIGTIPDAIADITGLEILQLDGNLMTGALPSGIFDLVELTKVRLESNSYTGILPSTIGKLSKMEVFRVDANMLSGMLPEEMSQMTALTDLWVSDNAFTGSIPDMSGAAGAEDMYFHNNALTGVMPAPMCELSSLVVLTSDCAGTPPLVECSCCTKCYPEGR